MVALLRDRKFWRLMGSLWWNLLALSGFIVAAIAANDDEWAKAAYFMASVLLFDRWATESHNQGTKP